MVAYLVTGSLIYSIGKDIIWKIRAKILGRRKSLSPSKIIEIRQKWKPLFEEKILDNHLRKLRKDVVIRDLRRLDNYPDVNPDEKGTSPWFRVGLMDTYFKGIYVGLNWNDLKKDEAKNAWRFCDQTKQETKDVRAILIGKIPFENIENVDWNGDEYYSFPHIYCWFDEHEKQPYEDLIFCTEHDTGDPNGRKFYVEICSLEDAKKLSDEMNIAHYFGKTK